MSPAAFYCAMTDYDPTAPRCPVGEQRCSLRNELVALRRLVSRLSEQIRTDTLTGLYNFRYFHQAMEQEMERTRRSGQPTGLIMLDLDHFKKINDSWGHEVGNRALTHVAKIMLESLRKFDVPCRYGGEEFAIILVDTDLSASTLVAERLRKRIMSSPLAIDGTEVTLRASFGLDVFSGGPEETTVEEMVRRVDSFLYQSKKNGRNRVSHPPLPSLEAAAEVGGEERRSLWTKTDARKGKKS